MYENDRLEELMDKYSRNEVNEPEFNELCSLIKKPGNELLLKGLLQQEMSNAAFTFINKENLDALLGKIRPNLSPELPQVTEQKKLNDIKKTKVFSMFRIAAAAVIILALGAGFYFIFFNKNEQKEVAKIAKPAASDIVAPVAAKAMITLANGQKIFPGSLHSGTLAIQGNVNVIKTTNGQIIYSGSSAKTEYNTMFNPRGSKVAALTLSDGSKVWLNSESSIRFPTAFTGKKRAVEITGEAYFEVTHNVAMPFIVTNGEASVTVLGTHFNINAYNDEENIKVTLLEGSVKLETAHGRRSATITPGQQAVLNKKLNITTYNSIDTDAVMAWKNGFFSFNKSDIQTVMKQISRWYNVEVSYEGNIPVMQFGGEVERDLSLPQVLQALEKSKVHFKMEGNKIIVLQ